MENNSDHGIRISRLPAERWEDSRKLRLDALRTEEKAFASSYEEEAKFESDVWKKRLKSAYFALDGDTPVGMITCIIRDRVKTHHVADIYGVYVKPDYRGKGVGKMLMESALSYIHEHENVIKVCLSVCTQQIPALNLYKKLGFEVVGEFKKELKIGDSYFNEVVMEKYL